MASAMSGLDALLPSPRYEVFPAKDTEQAVADWVPAGMTVTVTASPVKGLEPTIELTERLVARGYRVVPHLAARSVAGDAHLDEHRRPAEGLRRGRRVRAGRRRPASGRARSTARCRCSSGWPRWADPFGRIGITGYPESHPKIHDDITIQAMWDKRRYASYIVSNVCFDAGRGWAAGSSGSGPAASPCRCTWGWPGRPSGPGCCGWRRWPGASESARFITRHPGWILRFWVPGGYSPDRLLDRAAAVLTAPGVGRGRTAPVHLQPAPAGRALAPCRAGAHRNRQTTTGGMTHD